MRAASRQDKTTTTTIAVVLPAAVAFVLDCLRSEILHTIFVFTPSSIGSSLFVCVCVCVWVALGVQYAAINLQLSACQRFPSFVIVVVIDNTR